MTAFSNDHSVAALLLSVSAKECLNRSITDEIISYEICSLTFWTTLCMLLADDINAGQRNFTSHLQVFCCGVLLITSNIFKVWVKSFSTQSVLYISNLYSVVLQVVIYPVSVKK